MKRVVIVGAGIAGLSACHRLSGLASGKDLDIILLESQARSGGKILTEREQGLVIEGGPDCFVSFKPDALLLARELGIEAGLLPTDEENAGVHVFARGRLRRLPDGMLVMAPAKVLPFLMSDLMTWPGKLRMGMDLVLPRGPDGADESIGGFARRRFGAEAAETVVQPVMGGIYAGDAGELSLRSTFPRFLELEREHRSVILGLRRAARKAGQREPGTTFFMSFAGGLGQLVEALVKAVKPMLRLGVQARGISGSAGRYRVELDEPAEPGFIECDAVILTPLCRQAADIVQGLDAELASALRAIKCVSSAVAALAYDLDALGSLPAGHGFMAARGQGRAVAGVTFTHVKFPSRAPQGTALLRCFVGGAGREEAAGLGDDALLASVRADLRDMAGIRAEPSFSRVYRWPGANPQYTVGHEDRVRAIEALLARRPGLLLAGGSYRGIGIPDCIASGRRAAEAVFRLVKE